jgi:hypothetical protein
MVGLGAWEVDVGAKAFQAGTGELAKAKYTPGGPEGLSTGLPPSTFFRPASPFSLSAHTQLSPPVSQILSHPLLRSSSLSDTKVAVIIGTLRRPPPSQPLHPRPPN